MKVKDAILLASTELGIVDEVEDYLENGTTTGMGKRNTELLLTCFNLVESELALDYLPLYAEDEIKTVTGRILFSDLRHSAVHILRVRDEKGENLRFTLFPDCFKIAYKGNVKISYTYTPEPKAVTGNSDYQTLNTRLFSYGMACEYATAVGRYEEASVWDKKYKDALEGAYHATPPSKMRSRRWA